MKRLKRKTKIVVLCAVAVLLVVAGVMVWRQHSRHCGNIIGDGYDMGTDKEPVVIGNTCDYNLN